MDKVALVTGGTGALGRAVMAALHRDGYTVVGTAATTAERDAYQGAGQVTVVDLRDLDATRAFVSSLGQVHAAVLCAGGFGMQSLQELSASFYDAQLDVNLRTAANTLSALVPVLARPSAVVLVGSQAYRGAAGKAIYAAAKAAVVSLTRSAALELKSQGVRVNALLPDTIDTPTNRADMPAADFDAWAKPEELAEVVCFLCSDLGQVVSGNALRVGR